MRVSVDNEFGPVCERPRIDAEQSLQRLPHVVDATQALSPHIRTGNEEKVSRRHCCAQVTEAHPDWPGVWTDAGRYNSPACAVVGSGCDDDQGYDLIDCVYPHITEAQPSPASQAIAAAMEAGYYLRPRPFQF